MVGQCQNNLQRLDFNGWPTMNLMIGNILLVSLNDYPLAAERVKIGNVEKPIPNLNNEANYVVHYENLKLYERLGLKITKIHRGIKFEESAWLEEYINLNTRLKMEAKQSGNNFEVDFFKLVFGKKTRQY